MFSGVKASLSKLGKIDSLHVWAMITFMGGKCQLNFDNSTTHLILGRPEGVSKKQIFASLYHKLWLILSEIIS